MASYLSGAWNTLTSYFQTIPTQDELLTNLTEIESRGDLKFGAINPALAQAVHEAARIIRENSSDLSLNQLQNAVLEISTLIDRESPPEEIEVSLTNLAKRVHEIAQFEFEIVPLDPEENQGMPITQGTLRIRKDGQVEIQPPPDESALASREDWICKDMNLKSYAQHLSAYTAYLQSTPKDLKPTLTSIHPEISIDINSQRFNINKAFADQIPHFKTITLGQAVNNTQTFKREEEESNEAFVIRVYAAMLDLCENNPEKALNLSKFCLIENLKDLDVQVIQQCNFSDQDRSYIVHKNKDQETLRILRDGEEFRVIHDGEYQLEFTSPMGTKWEAAKCSYHAVMSGGVGLFEGKPSSEDQLKTLQSIASTGRWEISDHNLKEASKKPSQMEW